MHLFKEENFKVKIDPAAKLIKEFKILIDRDKDRQKSTALKELAYIYYYIDYKSPYDKYDNEVKHTHLVNTLHLGKWKRDSAIDDAIAIYAELQETSSILALNVTKKALKTSINAINKVEEVIKDIIEQNEIDAKSLIEIVEKLLKLSETLPKAIDTIEIIEAKTKKEQTENVRIKGGGKINLFEDV